MNDRNRKIEELLEPYVFDLGLKEYTRETMIKELVLPSGEDEDKSAAIVTTLYDLELKHGLPDLDSIIMKVFSYNEAVVGYMVALEIVDRNEMLVDHYTKETFKNVVTEGIINETNFLVRMYEYGDLINYVFGVLSSYNEGFGIALSSDDIGSLSVVDDDLTQFISDSIMVSSDEVVYYNSCQTQLFSNLPGIEGRKVARVGGVIQSVL